MEIEDAMSAHNELMKELSELNRFFPDLEIPPKIVIEMDAKILSYVSQDNDARILIEVPYQARFANPVGMFQGGMICAAIDNAFGPLSYLVAKTPTTTLDLNCKFIRPFTPQDESIIIEAILISKTKQILTMEAKVKNKAGKLIAIASTQFLILR